MPGLKEMGLEILNPMENGLLIVTNLYAALYTANLDRYTNSFTICDAYPHSLSYQL